MTPVFFFFREVQHVYCAKFMLTVTYNGNPILNNIYIKHTIKSNINNVLNQNVNKTKRARFATFAILL